MSGLLRRIRRTGAAEGTGTEPTALPDRAHGSAPTTPASGENRQPLPAGLSPEDLERRAATGRRSKLRRRARFLRRARELALRDLGGLVYEARRREQDPGRLAEEKVQRLVALDAELNELDAALGTPRGETVLREPGVGGTCPRCGELHASDATFCARCGVNLADAAREAAAAKAERQAEKAAAADAARQAAEKDSAQSGNGRTTTSASGEAATKRRDQPAKAQDMPAAGSAREPAAERPDEPASETAPKPAAETAADASDADPAVTPADAPTEPLSAQPATAPDRRS